MTGETGVVISSTANDVQLTAAENLALTAATGGVDITGQTDVTVKATTGAVALQSTGLDGEVAITGLAGVNVNSASTIGMATTGGACTATNGDPVLSVDQATCTNGGHNWTPATGVCHGTPTATLAALLAAASTLAFSMFI